MIHERNTTWFKNLPILQALREELNYASHLGLPAVMIQIKNGNVANLARAVNEHLQGGFFQQVSSFHSLMNIYVVVVF